MCCDVIALACARHVCAWCWWWEWMFGCSVCTLNVLCTSFDERWTRKMRASFLIYSHEFYLQSPLFPYISAVHSRVCSSFSITSHSQMHRTSTWSSKIFFKEKKRTLNHSREAYRIRTRDGIFFMASIHRTFIFVFCDRCKSVKFSSTVIIINDDKFR